MGNNQISITCSCVFSKNKLSLTRTTLALVVYHDLYLVKDKAALPVFIALVEFICREFEDGSSMLGYHASLAHLRQHHGIL